MENNIETEPEEMIQLAGRMQDAFMSMEATIPEAQIKGRAVQMSLNQVRTLHFIYKDPGIHQKEIAMSLAITQASVSVIVGKLISLELVERRPDELDGRAHGLHLSDLGKGVFREIRSQQIDTMREFLGVIPIDTLRSFVEAIEAALGHSQNRN